MEAPNYDEGDYDEGVFEEECIMRNEDPLHKRHFAEMCISNETTRIEMTSFKLCTNIDSRRDSTNRTVGYRNSKGKLESTRNV
jgi:hypothetical protein